MRAISCILWSSSKADTWVCVALPLSDLLTCKWCWAWLATWGRWVMHNNWQCWPSCDNSRPTISAVAPPMPTSTSSKMRLGVMLVVAMTTCMAKLMRDNSPPDAILAKGLALWPGLVLIRISMSSRPCGCKRESDLVCRLSSNRQLGMPNKVSCSPTAFSSCLAAACLALVRLVAAASYASVRAACCSWMASSWPSWSWFCCSCCCNSPKCSGRSAAWILCFLAML